MKRLNSIINPVDAIKKPVCVSDNLADNSGARVGIKLIKKSVCNFCSGSLGPVSYGSDIVSAHVRDRRTGEEGGGGGGGVSRSRRSKCDVEIKSLSLSLCSITGLFPVRVHLPTPTLTLLGQTAEQTGQEG